MNKSGIKFISSRGNSFVIETAKLKDKKYRDRSGLFCVEGIKLFREAIKAAESNINWEIRNIIAAEKIADEIFEFLNKFNKLEFLGISSDRIKDFLIFVSDEVYQKISSETAFQGVMCVLKKPDTDMPLTYKKPIVILDRVQDAGNAGTILRTANALCDCEFIFTQGCADLYNPKTLRAAMGANFYQTVRICGAADSDKSDEFSHDADKVNNNIEFEVENLKKNGYNILAAHVDKNSKSIEDIRFNAKTAIVFGNEGRGVSDDILSMCDERIIIPINENSESLNVSVAAGIIFWEMRKI